MSPGLPKFVRLLWRAGLYRYDLTSWRGPVLLLVSLLDVLAYAVAFWVVLAALFSFDSLERFVLIVIGLLVFRWSLGCAIQALRTAHFARIASPVFGNSLAAEIVIAVSQPTLVFVVSSAIIAVILPLVPEFRVSAAHLAAWWFYAFLVQLSWNLLLSTVIVYARLSRWQVSESAILFGFGLLLVVSPVIYQFRDIPLAASQILTSFNPASHLIAAYQNAFWFGRTPSLEVLPASAVVATVATLLLIARVRPGNFVEDGDSIAGDAPHKSAVLVWDGVRWDWYIEIERLDRAQTFVPWRGEMPWLNGRQVFDLIAREPGDAVRTMHYFESLSQDPGERAMLDLALPVCPDRLRDRICLSVALASPAENVLIDSLLDLGTRADIKQFDRAVRSLRWPATRRLIVRCRSDVVAALVAASA